MLSCVTRHWQLWNGLKQQQAQVQQVTGKVKWPNPGFVTGKGKNYHCRLCTGVKHRVLVPKGMQMGGSFFCLGCHSKTLSQASCLSRAQSPWSTANTQSHPAGRLILVSSPGVNANFCSQSHQRANLQLGHYQKFPCSPKTLQFEVQELCCPHSAKSLTSPRCVALLRCSLWPIKHSTLVLNTG